MQLDILEADDGSYIPSQVKSTFKAYRIVVWLTGRPVPLDLGTVYLPKDFDKKQVIEGLNANLWI